METSPRDPEDVRCGCWDIVAADVMWTSLKDPEDSGDGRGGRGGQPLPKRVASPKDPEDASCRRLGIDNCDCRSLDSRDISYGWDGAAVADISGTSAWTPWVAGDDLATFARLFNP